MILSDQASVSSDQGPQLADLSTHILPSGYQAHAMFKPVIRTTVQPSALQGFLRRIPESLSSTPALAGLLVLVSQAIFGNLWEGLEAATPWMFLGTVSRGKNGSKTQTPHLDKPSASSAESPSKAAPSPVNYGNAANFYGKFTQRKNPRYQEDFLAFLISPANRLRTEAVQVILELAFDQDDLQFHRVYPRSAFKNDEAYWRHVAVFLSNRFLTPRTSGGESVFKAISVVLTYGIGDGIDMNIPATVSHIMHQIHIDLRKRLARDLTESEKKRLPDLARIFDRVGIWTPTQVQVAILQLATEIDLERLLQADLTDLAKKYGSRPQFGFDPEPVFWDQVRAELVKLFAT